MNRGALVAFAAVLAIAHGTQPAVAQGAAAEFVAFRVDDRHVIAVVKDGVDMGDPQEKITPSDNPAAQYGFAYFDAGPRHLGQVPESIASARRWIVHLGPGSSARATAERVIAGRPSCDEAIGVLLTIDAGDQPAFAAQKALYFAAAPGAPPSTPAARNIVGVAPNTLPPDRRQALEALLAGVLARELPGVQQEAEPGIARSDASTNSHDRSWARARREVDAGLAAGRGRLTYDLQAFHLGPDGRPMYFVRAEWRVAGRVGFGVSLWLRGGASLEVVDQDLSPARWVRMFEFQGDVERVHYGQVLNVLDRDGDGWGEILFAKSGYESRSIQLLELTPTGWVPAGVSFSHGC